MEKMILEHFLNPKLTRGTVMRRENGSWQCHRINSLFVVNFDFHVQVTSFMNKESLICNIFTFLETNTVT